MHDRTGRHRRLPAAAGTLPGEWLGLKLPALADAASGADKTIRPPLRGEVAGARRPVWKPSVELRPRHWPIGFPSAHHKNIMATFGQLSTDPKQAQLLPLGAPEPTGGALFHHHVRESYSSHFPVVFSVKPFTPSDTYEFLSRWPFPSDRAGTILRIFSDLNTHSNLRDLCSNPLILA